MEVFQDYAYYYNAFYPVLQERGKILGGAEEKCAKKSKSVDRRAKAW